MTDDEREPNGTRTCAVTFTNLHERAVELSGLFDWECSRPVWDAASGDRCVWHAEVAEMTKPAAELTATAGEGDLHGAVVPETDFTDDALVLPDSVGFVDADLTGSDLTGIEFTDARLIGVRLANARLDEATLAGASVLSADLSDASLTHADLSDTNLARATLADAGLIGTDLTKAALNHAILTNANLSMPTLREATLTDADLTGAIVYRTDLSDAELRRTTLTDASLRDIEAQGAIFTDADLTDADLTNADLRGTTFAGATLTGADLSGVDFSGADLRRAALDHVGLYQTTLEDVEIDEATTAAVPSLWEQQADVAAESGLIARRGLRQLRGLYRSASDPAALEKAQQQYRRLERLYREAGLGRIQALEIQEKHAGRKRALAAGQWGRWARGAFSRWVLGYGLLYGPILRMMLFVIGISAVLYPVSGIADSSLAAATTETRIVTYETVPPSLSMETARTLAQSLYFSTITFSTLGYANLAPAGGLARAIATIESFIGALSMAYLVSVLSRRAVR